MTPVEPVIVRNSQPDPTANILTVPSTKPIASSFPVSENDRQFTELWIPCRVWMQEYLTDMPTEGSDSEYPILIKPVLKRNGGTELT